LFGVNDLDKIREILFLTTKLSVAVAVILAIFFIFYIPEVMDIWVSNKVTVNRAVFAILLLTAVLEVQHVATAQIAMACGYVKFAISSISSGIINLVLLLPLIKQFGLLGAALAVFLSQLITNNWYSVFVSIRFLKIKVRKFFIQVTLPILVYFIILLVFGYCYRFFFTKFINNSYLCLLVGMIGTVLMGLVLAVTILTTNTQKQFVINFITGRI
jgi:O-antigen/teichoic acid export membrane protein